MDNITWTLSANASQVRAEMTNVAASARKAGGDVEQSLNRTAAGYDNLLRSDHRVAGQLRRFTANVIESDNALQGLASGLQGIAMATNISLPVLIGLEVIAELISKITKAHSETVKLTKELNEAGKPRAADSKVPIAEDVAKRRAIAQKGEEDAESRKKFSIWNPYTWKLPASFSEKSGGSSSGGLGQGKGEMDALKGGPGDSWGKRMAMTVGFADAEAAAAKLARETADQIERQAESAERVKKATESIHGKLQFSLQELAKEGRQTAVGDDSRWGAGRAAKEAMKEEALARKEALAEHPEEAARHQMRAEEIKSTIAPLKDSEKEFLSALEKATVLQQIAKNTAQPLVNR